jgi:hypothetical protein
MQPWWGCRQKQLSLCQGHRDCILDFEAMLAMRGIGEKLHPLGIGSFGGD